MGGGGLRKRPCFKFFSIFLLQHLCDTIFFLTGFVGKKFDAKGGCSPKSLACSRRLGHGGGIGEEVGGRTRGESSGD